MHCWRGVLTHTIIVLVQPTYLSVRYLHNPKYFSSANTLWLTINFVIWTYIITQLSIPFFTSPFRHLPSPAGERFPIGHLNFNGGKPPTDNIARMVENTPNGGVLVLWLPLYLSCEILLTNPDLIMDVQNTHNYDWEKPAGIKRLLARTLGEGLAIVEGNKHKAVQKAVAPAFSGHQIRDLVPLFCGKGLAFADSLAREAGKSADGVLEMMAQMSRVTLDIIGAAGVGMDFNTIDNDENRLAKLYAMITDPPDRGPLWLFLPIMMLFPPWLIRQLKGTVYARITDAQMQLRSQVRALVQEKKRLMLQGKVEEQRDIIATIMKSGNFSDDYLVDQLLTFLAAGHDTTASALTWTTYLLALNPMIQDRLRAECNAELASRSTSEISASDFDAERMPYLTAVCSETLRLYPTVPATGRVAVRPTTVGTHHVPSGTSVFISPWAINRSPPLWGADADQYNPDRWLEGPNAANGGAKSSSALLTFSHGPRSCIGQGFARTEMKCLLAALVMRFRFEMADPDEKVEVGGFVTIKPHNGLRLKLHDLMAAPEARGDVKAEG